MTGSLRICMPEPIGRRGAGLGNELHGWAKAWLAAGALDAKALGPAWGLNPRGYRAFFGTSRFDWVYHRMVRSLLPTFRFGEEDYRATGERDFGDAVKVFADDHDLHDRSAFALVTGQMWGGLSMLRPAFPFVRSVLLSAAGTTRNLADLQRRISRGTLVIALHVRRGDFVREPDPGRPAWSQWNWGLALDWYMDVARSLQAGLDAPHTFVLFTDGSPEEMEPLVRELDPVTLFDRKMNDCSDLLAMTASDLLVCSRSSFSIWAAALSDRPYIWPEETLYSRGEDAAIWEDGEPEMAQEDPSRQHPRGVAVNSSGKVPGYLIEYLENVYSLRAWSTDLIFYGRVASGP